MQISKAYCTRKAELFIVPKLPEAIFSMKKGIFILVVLGIFLMGGVWGCDNFSSLTKSFSNGKEDLTKGKINGLTMRFEDGNPPSYAYANEDVEVNLIVQNVGSYDVDSLKAEFVGVVKSGSFDVSEGGVEVSLEGIDEFGASNPEIVKIGSFKYNKELFANVYEPLIEIEVCYDYGTEIVSDNFYVGKEEQWVSKGSVRSSDNSNGPVQIIKLDEGLYGKDVRFTFLVKHKGSGEIVDDCESDDRYEKDKVHVSIISPDANCRQLGGNEGDIYLVKGSKLIDCTVDIEQDVPYKDLFQAELSYTYKDRLSKKITIKKKD